MAGLRKTSNDWIAYNSWSAPKSLTGEVCLLVWLAFLGLKVTAFVRDVSRLPAELVDQVTIVQGDATVKSDVERAVRRHDAVVVALGTRNNLNATTVMSDGLRNVLDVMLEQSVNKVMSERNMKFF